MGRALADLLLEGRAADAESSAALARAATSRATSRLADEQVESFKARLDADTWEQRAKHLEQVLANTTAIASAGLVVMNAVIQTMETMPAAQREEFRDQVAQLARARMQKLDTERVNGENHVSIQKAFSERHQNEIFRII